MPGPCPSPAPPPHSAQYQRSCHRVPFGLHRADFPENEARELKANRVKPLLSQGLAPGTFPKTAQFGKVPNRPEHVVPSTEVSISPWAALRWHLGATSLVLGRLRRGTSWTTSEEIYSTTKVRPASRASKSPSRPGPPLKPKWRSCSTSIRGPFGTWLNLSRTGGLNALWTLEHKGDKGELTEEQQRQLKDEIQTGRFRTVKHVRQRIEQTFALAYSESGAKRLLQRLGCTSHKASGSCFKARRDKQRGVAPEVRGTQGPGRRDLASLLPRRRPTTVGAGVALQLLAAPWAASESAERQWPQTAEHLGGICPDDHEYLDRRNVKRNLTARSVIRPV